MPLRRGVPVDVRDGHGNTVLIISCQNGHKRALKAALRRGADPNARNERGNTGLHYCHAFGERSILVGKVHFWPIPQGFVIYKALHG